MNITYTYKTNRTMPYHIPHEITKTNVGCYPNTINPNIFGENANRWQQLCMIESVITAEQSITKTIDP